jgi:hypothetical protein
MEEIFELKYRQMHLCSESEDHSRWRRTRERPQGKNGKKVSGAKTLLVYRKVV